MPTLIKAVKGLLIILATGPKERLPVIKLYMIPKEQSSVDSSLYLTMPLLDKPAKDRVNIKAKQPVQHFPHIPRVHYRE